MNFTGAARLLRFILRRDRFRLLLWLLALAVLPIATANAFMALTPNLADREAMAATAAANPAFQILIGPVFGTSIGALTAWRVATLATVLGSLMAILTVIRHTREEEETGRNELVGATAVGRQAPVLAALGVVAIEALILAGMVVGGLVVLGLDIEGSMLFGLGYGLAVLAFAGVGALAAQVPHSAGAARGLGVGFLGIAFLLRGIGDATSLTFLRWLSPLGWFPQLRAFAGNRWWVLSLSGALTLATSAAAFVVSARRDAGEGLLSPRPGPARAVPSLSSAFALAGRLQRGALIGWALGLTVIGVVYGSIADSIGGLLRENPQLAAIFERLGGESALTEAFFATAIGVLALLAAAYATRAALRLQSEEEDQRAGPLLGTATSRVRWMSSHLVFSFLGSATILLIAGSAAGVTYGSISGDIPGEWSSVFQAALLQVPAVWVMAGLAAVLFGLSHRLAQASWGALVLFVVFGQLGALLGLPQWMLNLSPFSHVPSFPLEAANLYPLGWLLAIAVALVAAGLIAFRRRDLA